MTYCSAILVRDGLGFIADMRMSAAPDDFSTHRKLHLLVEPGERALAVATSGNLSASQAVINFLHEGIENPQTGEIETLSNVPTMFRAAQLIGRAIRHVRTTESEAFDWARLHFDVSILFGGQIKDGPMRLYLLYPAGNFVESSELSPFLQIGEHKYGKSILSRTLHSHTELYEAAKIGLISMDDALRSNVEVGLPIDFVVLRRGALQAESVHRIEEGERIFTICGRDGLLPCELVRITFRDHPISTKIIRPNVFRCWICLEIDARDTSAQPRRLDQQATPRARSFRTNRRSLYLIVIASPLKSAFAIRPT